MTELPAVELLPDGRRSGSCQLDRLLADQPQKVASRRGAVASQPSVQGVAITGVASAPGSRLDGSGGSRTVYRSAGSRAVPVRTSRSLPSRLSGRSGTVLGVSTTPQPGRHRIRAPAGGTRLVAAAAIVADGAVLAARRTAPPPVAGRWELPGGKVENGETAEQAAVREVAEELGVEVRAGRRLGRRHPIRPGLALVVVLAELTGDRPTSSAVHDELRWLRADQLDDVDWLPADRPLLPLLRTVLTARPDVGRGRDSAGESSTPRRRRRGRRRRPRAASGPEAAGTVPDDPPTTTPTEPRAE